MAIRKLSIFLALSLACSWSLAGDTYDTGTGTLTIERVKVGDTLYKNVQITLDSVVSVGTLVTTDSHDTYDAATNQLTIPVVNVGSTKYYNVVVKVGRVLSSASSCSISSTCSKVGTPEVKGVLPGDSRISVMFNYMGGKITGLLGSSTKYVPASAYVAVCTSNDGLHSASSTTSVEYKAGHANYANPMVVSGLINGKAYACTVTATADDAVSATSVVSAAVIPNAGSANANGVLSDTVNTAHAKAYPDYSSYCNYTNETATGLPAVATLSYYNTAGVWTSGTSKSTITCTASTRTVTSNALPDHLASQFFTNGLTGYTGMPYVSGQPNSIGEKSVSKTMPLSGTISTAYVKGNAGYDTSPCYSYTSAVEPNAKSNVKWAAGASVWTSGTVRCQWTQYMYFNNGVKVEPGTAETYTSSGIIYKAVGKNLYQDVGLDPSNSHNQPTMSSTGQTSKYGYYHYHGIPEGQVARLGRGNNTMTLVGFASDGFPVYARYGYTNANSSSSGVTVMKSNYRIRTVAELSAAGYSGRPPASIAPYGTFEQDWVYDATSSASNAGHLDACNGRYGVTPESPTTAVYHYYLTDSYPFVPRCTFGAAASWASDASLN